MTRRERLEAKLERRHEWAESRAQKAEAEWGRGDLREEKSGIPLGQPILVGHHSEARHRRAIERAENAMRRAHEHQEMSEHHESKAAGIERQLATTIFSDDEDAIEALQAKIAALEEERQRNNAVNKILRGKPKYKATPEKVAALVNLGLSAATAEKLVTVGVPAYVNQNLGGRIRAAKIRIGQIEWRNQKQAKAAASAGGVVIEGGDWVSITFSEKPDREILTALKDAGFHWGRGSWTGQRKDIPDAVLDLAGPAS